MELTSVKELYRNRDSYTDKKVTVGGWVRGNRDSKTFGFLVVNDGTFFETLQVVYDANKINNFEEIAKLKMPDLNANTIEAAISMIAGTARSMGVEVVD